MAGTFRKRLTLSIVLLAAPVLCRAQKPTAIPLVPAANWRQVDSETLGLEAVRNYGGDPAVEREYGVKALDRRTYRLGSAQVDVIVEPAADASAAFGLFTFYRTLSMVPEKGIQFAVTGRECALMVRGRNFIRFLLPKDSRLSENDYHALLIFVGGTRPSSQEIASLPPPIPAAGLIPGSEKYLLGLEAARQVLPTFRADLLGFDQGAEVQVGDYLSGKTRSRLVAINYPTPQMARIRLGAMTDFLGINRGNGPGAIYGRRQGSFVLLVLNADSSAVATKLMDQFKVERQLSWDRPYPGDKSFTIQVVELILANIFLSFILAGIAVLGGVLFFLSKRLAGRVFPNWQWGRTDEDALIRLNLR